MSSFYQSAVQNNVDMTFEADFLASFSAPGVGIEGMEEYASPKVRKKTNVLCITCKQPAKLDSGGSRSSSTMSNMYKYYCTVPTCGARFQRSRDPIPGTDPPVYKEQLSNFALSTEPPSKVYRCGKCGQPKKGHVCTVETNDLSLALGLYPPLCVLRCKFHCSHQSLLLLYRWSLR